MAADVISHRGAVRKRAPARGWTMRRVMAVALTLAALTAVAWVAPYLRPSATKIADPQQQQPFARAPEPALPFPVEAEAPAPVARARPLRPRLSGIPLDAQGANPGEDFEVLSAAELDAISQARGE